MANMLVLVVLMFACLGMVFSQAPSMAPPPDCSSALTDLVECLSFVEYGSKLEKPQGHCCAALKKVLKDDVSCLCEAFKQSPSNGVKLNMTKAFGLPHACGISTPSLSNCKVDVAGSPSSTPAPSSPGASSANSPASAPGTHSMAPLQAPSMLLFIIYIVVHLFFIIA